MKLNIKKNQNFNTKTIKIMIKIMKKKGIQLNVNIIVLFFNNKKFHLGNNWCLLLKIIKYIKNESENKNL